MSDGLEECQGCMAKLRKNLGRKNLRPCEKEHIQRFKKGRMCHACYCESLGVKPSPADNSLQDEIWDQFG